MSNNDAQQKFYRVATRLMTLWLIWAICCVVVAVVIGVVFFAINVLHL